MQSLKQVKPDRKVRQPAFFDRMTKEVKDLTGLDIGSFKDKKVRTQLIKRNLPYVLFGLVSDKLSYFYRLRNA